MENGMRVYYDELSSKIVAVSAENNNVDIPRVEEKIAYIDIPYGFDFAKETIVGVDVDSKTIITEQLQETPEQKRIRELEEDVLLLQAENEVGGIL